MHSGLKSTPSAPLQKKKTNKTRVSSSGDLQQRQEQGRGGSIQVVFLGSLFYPKPNTLRTEIWPLCEIRLPKLAVFGDSKNTCLSP